MVALSLNEAVLPEDRLVGAKVHGGPPSRRTVGAAERQTRDDEACHEETRQARQQPLPMAAADDIEADQRRCPSAAAGCRRTRAPAGGEATARRTVHQRPPKKTTPSRPPAREGQQQDGMSLMVIARAPRRMALSSWATQCQAFRQPSDRPATSNASVQEWRPDGACPARCPSAAPSSVGTTTDQPIRPIIPRPNQSLRRRAARLSLRAAFAPDRCGERRLGSARPALRHHP